MSRSATCLFWPREKQLVGRGMRKLSDSGRRRLVASANRPVGDREHLCLHPRPHPPWMCLGSSGLDSLAPWLGICS